MDTKTLSAYQNSKILAKEKFKKKISSLEIRVRFKKFAQDLRQRQTTPSAWFNKNNKKHLR